MSTAKPKPGMDPVADHLGGERPIALRASLVRIAGSMAAGALLSQFWYWTNTLPPERDGWFYKTQEEMAKETGMSRTEWETARKQLRERGITKEEKRGIPMRIWFRLDKDRIAELLRLSLHNQSCGMSARLSADDLQHLPQDVRDLDSGDPAGLSAEPPQAIPETTAKTPQRLPKKAGDTPRTPVHKVEGDDREPRPSIERPENQRGLALVRETIAEKRRGMHN